jgi:non-ribosomal peptide synthetase component F
VITLTEENPRADIARLREAWAGAPTFAYLPRRSPVTADWVAARLDRLPERLRTGHVVLLTSGSTGRPKLIVGARERAERLADALHVAQDNEPARSALLALPLSYSFAFVNQWVWSERTGRPLVPSDGMGDPRALRAALEDADAAMLCLVGVQGALIADAFAGASFDGVVRLHFAGGRFPQELLGRLRELFPAAGITNNYGCAEAMPRLTLRPADAAESSAHVGHPLEGIELRTDDEGRVLFRSPYGAVAVVEDDVVTEIGPQDWVPSGDLGEVLPDGALQLAGRPGEVV